MAKIEFYFLGVPELQIEGKPYRLHSKKVTALFAYLIIEDGRSHSRNRLAALLWGNSTDERARHSLRQALYSLQKALGESMTTCFEINAASVTYYPQKDLWVDGSEFLRLADDKENSDSLFVAASLYRGPLLDGLDLRDGGAYEEWLFFQRTRFWQHALNVNKILIKNLVSNGRYQEAIPYADWILTHDKLEESTHRLVMQLHAALGDLDAVRHQYALCVEILKDELGIEPSLEITHLYHELIAKKTIAASSPVVMTLELTDNATTYLRQAAQDAVFQFHYPSATDLYSRALTHQEAHHPTENTLRFDLLVERASVLERQGRRLEQIKDIKTILALVDEIDDERRKAQACLAEATLHAYSNQLRDAYTAGERALALYKTLSDTNGEINALNELAFLHWTNQDYGAALDYCRRVLDRHRWSGDLASEAKTLHNLGEIYRGLNSPEQALKYYEQALDLFWAVEDGLGRGMTLYGMSRSRWQMGKIDKAINLARRSLEHFMAAGDLLMASRAHQKLAGLYWEADEVPKAIIHIEQALNISRQIGYGPGMAHGLVIAGYLYALHGEIEKARIALDNAKIWFSLIDDLDAIGEIDRLVSEIDGKAVELKPPTNIGWVRGHVLLAGAKVFCEFETPMIRQSL